LCALGAAGIDAAGVGSRLCSFPLGLRVLFGPQGLDEFGEIDPRAAEALINTVSGMAERVVIDLPPLSSPLTQVVVKQCDFVLIVLERDPASVHAAKIVLRLLRAWGITQLVTGAIVVNRVTTYIPMPMSDIAPQIDCAILGVVPPAIDLCARANQAGSPVVFFQPESTLAGVLTDVALRFSGEPSALATRLPVRQDQG
jgi:Flp pilus assembly CpaE family ATPase